MVASDDMSNPLTIHLTDQNLSYVWELHQKEGFGEPMRERKLPRGVYHNPKRYQFVVTHPNKDKSYFYYTEDTLDDVKEAVLDFVDRGYTAVDIENGGA